MTVIEQIVSCFHRSESFDADEMSGQKFDL